MKGLFKIDCILMLCKYFRVKVFFPWIPQTRPVQKTPIKLKEPPQRLAAKLQPLLGMT